MKPAHHYQVINQKSADSGSGITSVGHDSNNSGLVVPPVENTFSPSQNVNSTKINSWDGLRFNSISLEKEHYSLNSKCDFIIHSNTNIKDQQSVEEPLSPSSSSCSSSSTVINSPIDWHSSSQGYHVPFQFHGKGQCCQTIQQGGHFQFQGKGKERTAELQNQDVYRVLHSKFDENRGDVFIPVEEQCMGDSKHNDFNSHEKYHWDCSRMTRSNNISAVLSANSTACKNDTVGSGSSTFTPLSFSVKRKRSILETDSPFDRLKDSSASRSDRKQDTHKEVTRKSESLSSPRHGVEPKRESESLINADGEGFISFGLAMAVCFMVSSGKKEINKMENILQETKHLICDMRKELEERKLRSCMDNSITDDDECFRIISNDKVKQESAASKFERHTDTSPRSHPCEVQTRKHGSLTGVMERQLYAHNCGKKDGAVLQCVQRNTATSRFKNTVRSTDNGEQQDADEWDSEDDNDFEEDNVDDVTSLIDLERKLWDVFQLRQEERILELESRLQLALHELHSKENELQWWKDCAYRLIQHFNSTSGQFQSGILLK
ncbi:hypothetical protein KP509_10G030300 [Ceratopteris richardii]|uniref:Protein POLAR LOCALIZATION DURING ASYMMETRIC DIVISION AND REDISTRIBUTION-like n=1 Tax=Ceratopteris richardii TaxID=49495 RepID=A0A8T2U3D5_CERRI|nr:hypothetical protein KP509_10G030300 [Ceratopteris richardii]